MGRIGRVLIYGVLPGVVACSSLMPSFFQSDQTCIDKKIEPARFASPRVIEEVAEFNNIPNGPNLTVYFERNGSVQYYTICSREEGRRPTPGEMASADYKINLMFPGAKISLK
jgi:hypothetical protein